MPAYVRLLAYFSNFILLASFLGIGIGCLLASSRRRLIDWFPATLLAVIVAVDWLRLEVAIPSTSSIYFSSGTAAPVVPVESTLLLPLLFVAVGGLFVTAAHQMGRQFAGRPPLHRLRRESARQPVRRRSLRDHLVAGNAAGGVVRRSWRPRRSMVMLDRRRLLSAVNIALLALALFVVYRMQAGSLWSPYYRITVSQDRSDTVVEVNHIFHQSMAPLAQKEYFYQWPYTTFGDSLGEVLVLGAGTGTDVAAALKHGARHVDAVDIDPVILRLGGALHPDHPYSDPRVTVICDDGRHFLRTTTKKYDLVVFALIDSLTVQSSFSGVRLESYMFTRESFEAVRDHLSPRGVMVLYNYFREKWLVDRLANTAAEVFGQEPVGHVHQDRAYLAVMLSGPRVAELTAPPPLPADVNAYGQPHAPSPAKRLVRDESVAPATDDWPFLYMQARGLPRHYLASLGLVLAVSAIAVWLTLQFLQRGLIRDQIRDQIPIDPAGAAMVVALLLPGRGVHAARNEVDRAVRAAVGIDVVVGVAGDRVGARHGAGQRADRAPRADPAAGRCRRRPPRADRAQLRDSGWTDRLRDAARGIALLRRAGVQSGVLRRPALQLELPAVGVHGDGLRRQPPRRDGRRRLRVSVAAGRLPVPARAGRHLLPRRHRHRWIAAGESRIISGDA